MNQNVILVLATCLTCFFGSFMSSSINVAIPAIAATYDIVPQLVPNAVSAYVITVTAFIFPSIALANRYGFRNIFAFGAGTSALAALLVPLAPSFTLFTIGRSLQGIFNASIFCTSMALLTYYAPKEKRGYYIGISVAAVYAGLTLSPTLGGLITDNLGWQCMFFLASLGNFLAFLLLLKIKKDPAVSSGYPYIRMLICTLSITAIFIGLAFITKSFLSSLLLLIGLILLAYYLMLEKRSKRPLLPINLLLDNRVLIYSLLASLCNYMATFAIALLLSMHLQLISNLSASETGFILMLGPLCQCLLSPLAGKLVGKISPHTLVLSGMALSTIATLIYANLSLTTALIIINLAQILGGIGFGLFSSPNTTLVMSSVDKTKLALVNGLQAFSRNLGMALCMAVITLIIALFIKVSPQNPEYVIELNETICSCFIISTMIGVLGMLFCLLGAYHYKKIHQSL